MISTILFSISIYNSKGLGYEFFFNYKNFILWTSKYVKSELMFKLDFARTIEKDKANDGYAFSPSYYYIYLPVKEFKFAGGIYKKYDMDFNVGSDTIQVFGYNILRKIHSQGNISSIFLFASVEKKGWYIAWVPELFFGKVQEGWEAIFNESSVYPDSFFYSFWAKSFYGLWTGYKNANFALGIYYTPKIKMDIKITEWLHEDTVDVYNKEYLISTHKRIFFMYKRVVAEFIQNDCIEFNTIFEGEDVDFGFSYRKQNIGDFCEYGVRVGYRMQFEKAWVYGVFMPGYRKGRYTQEFYFNFGFTIGFYERWEKRKKLWGG